MRPLHSLHNVVVYCVVHTVNQIVYFIKIYHVLTYSSLSHTGLSTEMDKQPQVVMAAALQSTNSRSSHLVHGIYDWWYTCIRLHGLVQHGLLQHGLYCSMAFCKWTWGGMAKGGVFDCLHWFPFWQTVYPWYCIRPTEGSSATNHILGTIDFVSIAC